MPPTNTDRCRAIFHVREPILPISGSLTFRVNKLLEKMASFDISLILPSNQNRELIDRKYQGAKLTRSRVPVPRTGMLGKYVASLLFAFETSSMLAKAIESTRSCVLYGYGASAAVALGVSRVRVPCVLDLFETELPYVMSEKSGLLKGPGKIIEKYVFSVANRPECKIAVISDAIRQYILTSYDVRSDIQVIYDTTDPKLFSPIDYDAKIADPIVAFTGDIYYRDGVDILVKAMAIVNDDMPNVKLFLAGDGPYMPRILKLAENVGVLRNLIAPGWLPFRRLVGLLPHMIIGVAPARPMLMNRLVIPRKVYEYMSAGAVTIASDLKAIHEIIKNKVSGLLVTPQDVQGFAEAILHLLNDRGLYTRLQLEGRKKIEKLSVDREVGRLLAIIEDVT